MKGKWTFIGSLLAVALLALAVGSGQAQGPQPPTESVQPQGGAGIQAALVGTAFTYQGQLKSGGNPVNGTCDFQFTLYDAASGGTSLGTQTKTGVSVTNGLFTIPDLDFGAGAFQGDARWLQIEVKCAGDPSYTTLTPRQALTAAPYALGLRPNATVIGGSGIILTLDGGNIGLTASSTTYGVWGQSASTGGRGVYGLATATSGWTYGVQGESWSTAGHGVAGYATAASGTTYGVYGQSNSTSGRGVVGLAGATSGTTYGVYGLSYSTAGRGVYGLAGAASGTTYGVYGESASTRGTGMYGWATAATGVTYGVSGRSDSRSGIGVSGYATATSGHTYGVWGLSNSDDGVGVWGVAGATYGSTYGVRGQSDSDDGTGVFGWVTAASGYNAGVWGQSDSINGTGVFGWATATSGNNVGVFGQSDGNFGIGVSGLARATSGINYGVYGSSKSPAGYGGYFAGNVHVTGNLSVSGSKPFKIDHPLDPAGRYLYHFAQEGPEVQNVYNGVITLDANGEAVVALPAYFSALNAGPFRYQLTPIGAPMPNLHIAQKIQDNAFKIAGGVPGMEVSWEVTAVRNDPYLRDHPARAEVDKPAGERGTYLYPEGYGQPRELGLDYQRNRDLLERPEGKSLPTGGER